MKKLNTILAAISTAALTFCVWGTQTQAKVITNRYKIPTHIEADTEEEFFGDLQEVLDQIALRLVFASDETTKIQNSFLKDSGQTRESIRTELPYSEWTEFGYAYALRHKEIHKGIAEGYLYNLLLKSTISNHQINNVHRLVIHIDHTTYYDIIFQLPTEPIVYYTPCLRWFSCPHWKNTPKLKPSPMTVQENFGKSPELKNPTSPIFLAVMHPDLVPGYTILYPFPFQKTGLIACAKSIIPKLISIADRTPEDAELEKEFIHPSNLITDYDTFVKEYKKHHK